MIFCTLSLLVLEIVASTSNNDNLRVYDSFRGAIVDLHTKCKSTSNLYMLTESKNFIFKIKLIFKMKGMHRISAYKLPKEVLCNYD